VNLAVFDHAPLVIPLQAALDARVAGVRVDVRQLEIGEPVGVLISVRVVGDDEDTLRGIATRLTDMLRADPRAARIRNDWGSEGVRGSYTVEGEATPCPSHSGCHAARRGTPQEIRRSRQMGAQFFPVPGGVRMQILPVPSVRSPTPWWKSGRPPRLDRPSEPADPICNTLRVMPMAAALAARKHSSRAGQVGALVAGLPCAAM